MEGAALQGHATVQVSGGGGPAGVQGEKSGVSEASLLLELLAEPGLALAVLTSWVCLLI